MLRSFDLQTKFGPCMGMTRLERWAGLCALCSHTKDSCLRLFTGGRGPRSLDWSLRQRSWHCYSKCSPMTRRCSVCGLAVCENWL